MALKLDVGWIPLDDNVGPSLPCLLSPQSLHFSLSASNFTPYFKGNLSLTISAQYCRDKRDCLSLGKQKHHGTLMVSIWQSFDWMWKLNVPLSAISTPLQYLLQFGLCLCTSYLWSGLYFWRVFRWRECQYNVDRVWIKVGMYVGESSMMIDLFTATFQARLQTFPLNLFLMMSPPMDKMWVVSWSWRWVIQMTHSTHQPSWKAAQAKW